MKKSIALFLAVVLLISVIGTALAAHGHTWQLVSISKKVISKVQIPYEHGCIHLSIPHVHYRFTYRITQIYICSKGCGATKTNTYISSEEICPWLL